MLAHLKMEWTEFPDGSRTGRYTNPDERENWIDDPCTFCGGESFSAVCPGDGRPHRHGGIHLPDSFGPGYGYLCRSPECKAKAEQAWRDHWKAPKVG